MQSFVLTEDSAGTVWAETKCHRCGDVHKYAPADVFAQFLVCKGCNQPMQMSGELACVDPNQDGGVRLWNVRDAVDLSDRSTIR